MSDEEKPTRGGLIGAIQARMQAAKPPPAYQELTVRGISDDRADNLEHAVVDVDLAKLAGGVSGIMTIENINGELTVTKVEIVEPLNDKDQP